MKALNFLYTLLSTHTFEMHVLKDYHWSLHFGRDLPHLG